MRKSLRFTSTITHERGTYERTNQKARLDYKVFPIGVDAPLKITLNRDTGALSIQQTQLHPAVKGGITMAFLLSPAATRELVLALKRLETELGKPIEDLAMPDSVQ